MTKSFPAHANRPHNQTETDQTDLFNFTLKGEKCGGLDICDLF